MSQDFDWNDIPLILALVRGGSINAAAHELKQDASTVRRRAAAAERRLQACLFVPSRDGIRLTETGPAFVGVPQIWPPCQWHGAGNC